MDRAYQNNSLCEAYILGNRLITFHTTLLPKHVDYASKTTQLAQLRLNSLIMLGKIRTLLLDIVTRIDTEEWNKATKMKSNPITDENTKPVSNSLNPGFPDRNSKFNRFSENRKLRNSVKIIPKEEDITIKTHQTKGEKGNKKSNKKQLYDKFRSRRRCNDKTTQGKATAKLGDDFIPKNIYIPIPDNNASNTFMAKEVQSIQSKGSIQIENKSKKIAVVHEKNKVMGPSGKASSQSWKYRRRDREKGKTGIKTVEQDESSWKCNSLVVGNNKSHHSSPNNNSSSLPNRKLSTARVTSEKQDHKELKSVEKASVWSDMSFAKRKVTQTNSEIDINTFNDSFSIDDLPTTPRTEELQDKWMDQNEIEYLSKGDEVENELDQYSMSSNHSRDIYQAEVNLETEATTKENLLFQFQSKNDFSTVDHTTSPNQTRETNLEAVIDVKDPSTDENSNKSQQREENYELENSAQSLVIKNNRKITDIDHTNDSFFEMMEQGLMKCCETEVQRRKFDDHIQIETKIAETNILHIEEESSNNTNSCDNDQEDLEFLSLFKKRKKVSSKSETHSEKNECTNRKCNDSSAKDVDTNASRNEETLFLSPSGVSSWLSENKNSDEKNKASYPSLSDATLTAVGDECVSSGITLEANSEKTSTSTYSNNDNKDHSDHSLALKESFQSCKAEAQPTKLVQHIETKTCKNLPSESETYSEKNVCTNQKCDDRSARGVDINVSSDEEAPILSVSGVSSWLSENENSDKNNKVGHSSFLDANMTAVSDGFVSSGITPEATQEKQPTSTCSNDNIDHSQAKKESFQSYKAEVLVDHIEIAPKIAEANTFCIEEENSNKTYSFGDDQEDFEFLSLFRKWKKVSTESETHSEKNECTNRKCDDSSAKAVDANIPSDEETSFLSPSGVSSCLSENENSEEKNKAGYLSLPDANMTTLRDECVSSGITPEANPEKQPTSTYSNNDNVDYSLAKKEAFQCCQAEVQRRKFDDHIEIETKIAEANTLHIEEESSNNTNKCDNDQEDFQFLSLFKKWKKVASKSETHSEKNECTNRKYNDSSAKDVDTNASRDEKTAFSSESNLYSKVSNIENSDENNKVGHLSSPITTVEAIDNESVSSGITLEANPEKLSTSTRCNDDKVHSRTMKDNLHCLSNRERMDDKSHDFDTTSKFKSKPNLTSTPNINTLTGDIPEFQRILHNLKKINVSSKSEEGTCLMKDARFHADFSDSIHSDKINDSSIKNDVVSRDVVDEEGNDAQGFAKQDMEKKKVKSRALQSYLTSLQKSEEHGEKLQNQFKSSIVKRTYTKHGDFNAPVRGMPTSVVNECQTKQKFKLKFEERDGAPNSRSWKWESTSSSIKDKKPMRNFNSLMTNRKPTRSTGFQKGHVDKLARNEERDNTPSYRSCQVEERCTSVTGRRLKSPLLQIPPNYTPCVQQTYLNSFTIETEREIDVLPSPVVERTPTSTNIAQQSYLKLNLKNEGRTEHLRISNLKTNVTPKKVHSPFLDAEKLLGSAKKIRSPFLAAEGSLGTPKKVQSPFLRADAAKRYSMKLR